MHTLNSGISSPSSLPPSPAWLQSGLAAAVLGQPRPSLCCTQSARHALHHGKKASSGKTHFQMRKAAMLTPMAAGSSTTAMHTCRGFINPKTCTRHARVVQVLTQTHATALNVDQARREECCLPEWQHDVMAWPLGQPFEHAGDLLAALCLLMVSLKPLPAVCNACLSLLPESLSCMLQVLEGVLRLRPNSRLSASATAHGNLRIYLVCCVWRRYCLQMAINIMHPKRSTHCHRWCPLAQALLNGRWRLGT